jgi:pyocin large subunit-like protein
MVVRVQRMDPLPERTEDGIEYYEYAFDVRYPEREAVGSGWAVKDAGGADAPAHTVNYDAGVITFTADTEGTTYYLDARGYNPYWAAADVWEAKAGRVASRVDWQSDNHRVSASQTYQHYLAMARQMRGLGESIGSGITVGRLFRTDEA